MPRKIRPLPQLSPGQVIALQDALLANAEQLLTSALAVLDLGNVALARSLAILGMEESGKAIALHERRVSIALAPEGEPFVTDELSELWAHHQMKLELVHRFLVEEQYWFGTEPADPATNETYLGTIKRWTTRHDKLKKRGFYVEIDKVGDALTPAGVADEESLAAVISHVHQIGWQLRLGEHIEATRQADLARDVPPATEADIEQMRKTFSVMGESEVVESVVKSMRAGMRGRRLHNDAYRLKLFERDSNPFANVGRPGYEAQTRELLRLQEELDRQGGD